MSNKKHFNLDQLVIAIILSSSKTKQAMDQLIMEVCKLAVSKKYLPVEELCLQYPWACHVLQEILHIHNFLQNTINNCLLNLKRYYDDQWSTDRFKEFQSIYGSHIRYMVPSDFSNTMAGLAEGYAEVMENIHYGHDIGMKDAEKKQNNLVAVVHGIDVKLQQEVNSLGTNLFKIMTSLKEENWDMLSKTCAYDPDKPYILEFEMPAVIWPIAVKYDLDLLQKILRNKRKRGKQSEPRILRLQSTVPLQSLATHDVLHPPLDPPPSVKPLIEDWPSDLIPLPARSCLQTQASAQILPSFPAYPFPDFSPLQSYVSSSQPHSFIHSLHPPSVPSLFSSQLLLQATILPPSALPSVTEEVIVPLPSVLPPVCNITLQQSMHQVLYPGQSFPQALPASDMSSFHVQSFPQVLLPPDMLPTHAHSFPQTLPYPHTFLWPSQSSEIHPPQKMCPYHTHSFPHIPPAPDMPPFHTHYFPHTPPASDMPPFHTYSFPHTLPPLGMSPFPDKYTPQALPPSSYMSPFSTKSFPQTLPLLPALSSLSAQPFQQDHLLPTAQHSHNVLSLSPGPPSPVIQPFMPPESFQQASPPSSSLPLPQAQFFHSTVPSNPELPSSPVLPLMSHMIECPQGVYLSAPAHPHPLPARKKKNRSVFSRKKQRKNAVTHKISSPQKEFNSEISFTEDIYIPFVTKSQILASTRDLPDRGQVCKNVPMLECSDNSVTSERSSKLHLSAKVSTKEQAEKNCEEKIKSRRESQNDHVQGPWSPRKQHTHNPQENMNTIQCFSEDIDENLDDCIPEDDVVPIYALPMVELPLPYIMPKEHVEEAVLLHVQNPGHFYLVLGRQGTLMVERLSEDLQDRYKDDDEPLKVWELPLGSCWAAQWIDGCWYRVKVIANIAPLKGEIYPVYSWENEPWPASTTQAFVDMCLGSVPPLKAYVLSKCPNGTYGVILERRDGEVVNLRMVHDGLAVSKLLKEVLSQMEGGSTFPSQLPGVLEKQDTGTELPNDWNPMSEAFKSSSNTIYLNDECVETMLLGRRNTDGKRQCKYHRAGRQCPRGETCPWEHTPVRDDITVEKEMALAESFLPSALPTQGSLLAARVTSIASPSCFYIHLPFGTKNLTDLGHEGSDSETELEVLVSAMQKYYSQRGHPWLKSLSLPAPGELMVLLESGSDGLDCSRVLVLEVNDCKEDACQAKVFFIDFGYEEWVKQEILRPLAPQFAHVTPHAVECWLSGVNSPAKGWSAEATEILKKMTEEHTLVAHILQVDSDFQRVGVVLIDTEKKQKTSINEAFISSVYKEEKQ
uniref:C3H1-type domain-containing protein n=1 Tax=Scylla olivacea TaxID=85551 RepID=A0A0P4VYH4_SCYOL